MQHEAPHYVYALINPRNHYPFYVGMTNSLEQRYEQHLESREGKKRASIVRELEAAGLKPVIAVLERKPNRRLAKIAEVFWIELLGSRGVPIVNKEILGGVDAVGFHVRHAPTPKRRSPETPEIATAVQKLQRRPESLPAKHGKPWSESDIQGLRREFESGATLEDVAATFERTYLGVLGQLQKLAHKNDVVYGKLAELGLLKSQEAYRQAAG
jgi:hypothetical protein